MDDIITLDHGSGGKKTARLIEEMLLPALGNPALNDLGDGAVVGDIVFSTDSFVVSPSFPGGDIGKLSVCGTVNDLCMCGGKPEFLSLGLILEEGLPLAHLERIIHSIAHTAKECGVEVVTGDTKVVERGRGDGIYINTAGIGRLVCPGLSPKAIREGDAVLLSGSVGEHGAAVMLAREELGMTSGLLSDCAPLTAPARACFRAGVRALRDPTRGGVATTLNEFVNGTGLCIELTEAAIPVSPGVKSACDMLGLDPLYCACEGRLLAVTPGDNAQNVLLALRAAGCPEAAVIGRVSKRYPGRVVLNTPLGGARILIKLTGAQLPRIC